MGAGELAATNVQAPEMRGNCWTGHEECCAGMRIASATETVLWYGVLCRLRVNKRVGRQIRLDGEAVLSWSFAAWRNGAVWSEVVDVMLCKPIMPRKRPLGRDAIFGGASGAEQREDERRMRSQRTGVRQNARETPAIARVSDFDEQQVGTAALFALS